MKRKLILASASPRRRELMGYFPIPIEVVVPEVDESVTPGMGPAPFAQMLAERKAAAIVAIKGNEDPVLAADTIVVIDDEILGKPRDAADAVRMLTLLSGRTHQVITGVAILWDGKEKVFSVSTDVTFKELTPKEIADYIATKEPMDKAGAYAIQGTGGFMVTEITGSASNVIGLPVAETIAALQNLGFLNGLALNKT
ncbi:MAG TPA: Maf family protein [bacterium]|nr:Maf family protein [bacterium]